MKLFVDGSVFNYDGQGRGWQQIVNWVNKHIDRDHVLKNVDDIDHYLHDNTLNVVGLFPDGLNSTAFPKVSRHFSDVMFAEARGTTISAQVAEHIGRFARLQCEAIDVGRSGHGNREKTVPLPREGMTCDSKPMNPQHPNWHDTFAAVVEGVRLRVTRTDDIGWDQLLKLHCCNADTKKAADKRYDVTAPSVVMFMPHDEQFDQYTGSLDDAGELQRWVAARRTPMIMELTETTAEKILDSGQADKMPVMFLINGNAAHKTVMRKVAGKLRGRVLICFSGSNSQVEKRLMEMVGVEEDVPVVALIEVHDGQFGQPMKKIKKYRLEFDGKRLDETAVEKFVDSYERHALTPWLRSEPLPSPEDMRGPVGILVGSNFEREAVMSKDHDVLVNFFAPWCGHCKKFEPNYKSLAKKLKHVPTLKIMKIDATRNEVENIQIMAFPTVLLFPAGDDKLRRRVPFSGHRSPEDITAWLKKHCTHSFSEIAPVNDKPTPEASSGLLDDEEEEADL
jgi:protein disulfide-isomerase A1